MDELKIEGLTFNKIPVRIIIKEKEILPLVMSKSISMESYGPDQEGKLGWQGAAPEAIEHVLADGDFDGVSLDGEFAATPTNDPDRGVIKIDPAKINLVLTKAVKKRKNTTWSDPREKILSYALYLLSGDVTQENYWKSSGGPRTVNLKALAKEIFDQESKLLDKKDMDRKEKTGTSHDNIYNTLQAALSRFEKP